MSLLNVSGICKGTGAGAILTNISFSQERGRHIAVAGETGSGKSTLMKTVGGLAQPDSGLVLFEGKRVKGPDDQLIPGHPGIAYLSQYFELRNHYRVEELLGYANELSDEDADSLYGMCQISHLVHRKTTELSGGEKQRVALARLLITAPRLLLLDEPFSNLDIIHKTVLKSVIRDISARLDITCMMISHDPLDILPWADEIIVLKDGQIVQQGSSETVYRKPVNEYVAGLFGSYNLMSPELVRAFGIPPRRNEAGHPVILRPGQFRITGPSNESLRGIIREIHFLGGYYEVEVALPQQVILVRSEGMALNEGDEVYIGPIPAIMTQVS